MERTRSVFAGKRNLDNCKAPGATAPGALHLILPVPPVGLVRRTGAVLGVVDGQAIDVEDAPVHLTALGQAVPAVELLRVLALQAVQGGTADAL